MKWIKENLLQSTPSFDAHYYTPAILEYPSINLTGSGFFPVFQKWKMGDYVRLQEAFKDA